MQTTIDRNVDNALRQSESVSLTQQKAQVLIGSDEFLDLALELKKFLVQSRTQLEGLNSSLIYTLNVNPDGVTKLMPKLQALANSCHSSIQGIGESILAACLGEPVLSSYQIEIDQLNEIIEDIKYNTIGPSEDLQELFDQL